MARIEARLKELGLALPAPLQLPPGAVLPFPWMRITGAHARSAVGMAELPFDIPVEIEAEVELMPLSSA